MLYNTYSYIKPKSNILFNNNYFKRYLSNNIYKNNNKNNYNDFILSLKYGLDVNVVNKCKNYTVNKKSIIEDVKIIRYLLRLDHLPVDVSFVDENEIKIINKKYRGKDKSTDVISLAYNDFKLPILPYNILNDINNNKDRYSNNLISLIENNKNNYSYLSSSSTSSTSTPSLNTFTSDESFPSLGDIILCPKYIEEVMKNDMKELEEEEKDSDDDELIIEDDDDDEDDELKEIDSEDMNFNNNKESNIDKDNIVSNEVKIENENDINIDEEDEDEDRGVSLVLRNINSLSKRYPLLLIHSILHLSGHDHETDDDWKIMTDCEEFLIKEYYQYKKLLKKI